MHCTAWLTVCPFCMRGREEALASCCSCLGLRATLAISAGGRRTGTGAQGGLGAWPSVPREQEIGAEQEHVEAGGAGDAGRRAGMRQRVRCKRSR